MLFFKIGGILCHSSYANGMYHVTNGIGLNLDNVVCINWLLLHLTLFIQAPTACINSLLFSVIEEFKCEEKNRSMIDGVFCSLLNIFT